MVKSPGLLISELHKKPGLEFDKYVRDLAKKEICTLNNISKDFTRCEASGLMAGIQHAIVSSCADESCEICASRIGC